MPDAPAWRRLYPFRSHYLTINGHRYHYVDEGEGPPLLLVHGNPTWSFYWRELIRAMSPTQRVIAVDHLGCGLSDKPANFSYRLADHVGNLRQLIQELDLQQATLVAHDWGGAIGLGAAGAEADRFSRLVLLNTAAFRSDQMPWRIWASRIPLLGTLANRGGNAFLRAALVMGTEHPEQFRGAIGEGYLAPYDSWANRIAIDRFVRDIPLGPAHPSYRTLEGIEQGLAKLRDLPTLLIWGMRDWCFTPHFMHRFQQEFFPAAETLPLPEAGHFVMEDGREQVLTRLNQFLAAHPVAASASGDSSSTGENDASDSETSRPSPSEAR